MDWSKLKVTELKAELKDRGLQTNGLKAELVARLESADAEQAEAPAEAGTEPAEEAAPETLPSANGHVRAADEPPAEPSGGTDDNEEEMMDTEKTDDVQAEEEVAHKGDDSAQQASAPAASAAVEPPPEPTSEQAPEAETKLEPMATDEAEPSGQATDAAPAAATSELEKTEAAAAEKDVHAPSSPERREEIGNVSQDIQKRKRSSSSAPPDEAERKRHRGDTDEDVAMELAKDNEPREAVDDDYTSMVGKSRPSSPGRGTRDDVELAEEPAAAAPAPEAEVPSHVAHPTVEPRHFPGIEPSSHAAPETAEEMDVERDVEPSIHPATSALYIKNFMRPLRAPDVRKHLAHLANPSGGDTVHDDLEDFFLDQIRTHAFAVFKSVSAASRVRNALHNRVWPDEANRKPLWVDFVPAEKVRGWIETEEAQGGSRSSTAKRWTVTYDDGGDSGDVVAHLELDDATSRAPTGPSARGPAPPAPAPARPPPRGPAFESTNMIPLGPRAQRGNEGPPPRPNMPPGRGPPGQPGGTFGTTTTRPYVTFRLVSEDVARQRIDDMQSYYTKDYRRDYGKEINRYTFEDGVHFVDRGAEVFEGIRPPHRERERQMERRGGRGGRGRGRGGPRFGGRGPPPFSSRSDRYLPGLTDRGDRPMFGDSPPRHRNDRFEDDYRKDAGRLHFEDDRDPRDDYRNDRDGRY